MGLPSFTHFSPESEPILAWKMALFGRCFTCRILGAAMPPLPGGYLTMGIAGGTGGLVCGGSIGALVGLAPAPFTAGQGASDAANST